MTRNIINSRMALHYEGLSQENMAELIERELLLANPDIVIDAHLLALGPDGQIETSFGTVELGEVIVHAPFLRGHNGFPLRVLPLRKDSYRTMREYGHVEHRVDKHARSENILVRSGFIDHKSALIDARISGVSPYCVVRTFTPTNNVGYLDVSMWQYISSPRR